MTRINTKCAQSEQQSAQQHPRPRGDTNHAEQTDVFLAVEGQGKIHVNELIVSKSQIIKALIPDTLQPTEIMKLKSILSFHRELSCLGQYYG